MRRRAVRQPAAADLGILLVLAFAIVLPILRVSGLFGASPQSGDSPQASPPVLQAVSLSEQALPGVVWDLAYDAGADSVWFVSGNGDEAGLYSMPSAGKPVLVTSLPPGQYAGVHHDIAISAVGAVILNEDYSVVAYSPASKSLQSAHFDVKVDGALPGALDPDDPMPGTWISALEVEANRVFVARNKVPFITVLDATTLEQVDTIPVDAAYAGVRRMAFVKDALYLLSTAGAVTMLDLKTHAPIATFDRAGAVDISSDGLTVMAADSLGAISELGIGPTSIAPLGSYSKFGSTEAGAALYDEAKGLIHLIAGSVELGAIQLPPTTSRNQVVPRGLADFVITPAGTLILAQLDSPAVYVGKADQSLLPQP